MAAHLNISNMRAQFGSVHWSDVNNYFRIQTLRYRYVLAGKQNYNNL